MSKRTEIKLEFVGASGSNPFIANVSSPRAVMDSNHLSQALSLINPTENLIKTGIEYELAKYVNDDRLAHTSVVKAMIPKYNSVGDKPPSSVLFFEYEKDDCIFLDMMELNTHKANSNVFGYETMYSEAMENISHNSMLEAGTPLTTTKTISPNGSYMLGRSTNVALMSHPGVAEDGMVISESFAKNASYLTITKRVINVNKNTIPLNINGYGKEGPYRFLPDIGESVREDGLLCAYRERNDWFSVVDLEDKALSEFDPIFDIASYVPVGSEVIDIEVIRGDVSRVDLPPRLLEQLEGYAEKLNNYYERIISAYTNITKERKKYMGDTSKYRLTPRLRRYITDCTIKVQSKTSKKVKLVYKREPIDGYRIEVTVKTVTNLNKGNKLTEYHA